MAFPDAPLGARIELLTGPVWTDITGDVLLRETITIERGRRDEGAQVDAASCSMQLRNTLGKYSPRNPLSPYFGQLGRNTLVRIHVPYGPVALTNLGAGRVTCPAPATAITGDLDVRVDLTADDWTSGGGLAGRYRITGDQRSWALTVGSDDRLTLIWTTNGTLAARRVVASTAPIPVTPGRRVLRATLDVDNGSGGHVVRFFYSSSLTGPWTQIGNAVTGTGTTSVHAGTAPVEVGDVLDIEGAAFAGRYHRAQVRNGVNGPVVAGPDFTAQTPGATSFVDGQGNVWTIGAGTTLDRRNYRFVGEISAWPPRWDVSGRDVWVPIEAAGVLRRYRQGIKPLRSALYRHITGLATPYKAYWSLEDSEGATQVASGYAGGKPMAATGEVHFEQAGPPGSAGAVSLGGTGRLLGGIPYRDADWCIAFWYDLTIGFDAANDTSPAVQWRTFGSTFLTWSLRTEPGLDGRLGMSCVDGSWSSGNSAFGSVDLRGRGPVQIAIQGVQSGSNVLARVYINGTLDFTLTTPAADTVAPITFAGVNAWSTEGEDTVGTVSHMIITSAGRLADVTSHLTAAAGHAGETAVARAQRIALEEGIPLDIIDTSGTGGEQVGPQRVATALELIGEASDADGGVLYERMSPPGLTYRTRASDYSTPPAAVLDYTAGEIAPPLEPVDDDSGIRNDITVSRPAGSSARAVDETSPLSVLPPPFGIGRYDEAVDLNLFSDEQLAGVAAWRLYLGTRDQARYPMVPVNLHKRPHLIDAMLGVDVRSRLRLTNLPPWLPPGDVDVLVEGYTEVLGEFEWRIEFNCAPGSPWNVAFTDDPVFGRADTDGSQLSAGVSATATVLQVAVTAGPLWTTVPAHFPFSVTAGGEEMTVTGITGTASPQTFTVVRAVNGISKGHAAGTAVRLTHPAIAPL